MSKDVYACFAEYKNELGYDLYSRFSMLAEYVCSKALLDNDFLILFNFDLVPGINLKEEGGDYFIISDGRKNAEASILAHFGYKTIHNIRSSKYVDDVQISEFTEVLQSILKQAESDYKHNFLKYDLVDDVSFNYLFSEDLMNNFIFIRYIKYLPVLESRTSIGKPHLDRSVATLHLYESNTSFLHIAGVGMGVVPDTKYFIKENYELKYKKIYDELMSSASTVDMHKDKQIFFLGAGYANLNSEYFRTDISAKLGYHTVKTSDLATDRGVCRSVLIAFLLPRPETPYTYFRPTTLFSRRLDLYVDPKADRNQNNKL